VGTELVTRLTREEAKARMEKYFAGAAQAFADLMNVRSFDDLERRFIAGRGLSPGTYANYTNAVKKVFESTGGLTPVQWTAVDIERAYNRERERNGIGTAYGLVMGVKAFYRGLCAELPMVSNPFDGMDEGLYKRLHTTPNSDNLGALYQSEIDSLLTYLRENRTLKGRQTRVMVELLLTTGLRVSEMCHARFGDIQRDTDKGQYRLVGIGKGNKPFDLALSDYVYGELRQLHKAQFKTDPTRDRAVIYSTANYNGKEPAPMSRNVAWKRIVGIGNTLQERGEIRADLKFSPHTLRRTYLTQLLKKGLTVSAVQKAARHSSLNTTARYLDDDTDTVPFAEQIIGVGA